MQGGQRAAGQEAAADAFNGRASDLGIAGLGGFVFIGDFNVQVDAHGDSSLDERR
jgi:hypothetical protein